MKCPPIRQLCGTTLALSAVLATSLALPADSRAAQLETVPSPSVVTSVAVTEGTNMSATLSPDHTTILLDLQEALWSLPIAGGTAKRLTDPMLEPSRPDWSPRGDLIAFQGYQGGTFHIWLMKPDGTAIRQLTNGHGDDREPRISPDGSKVAFASDRAFKGNYDIWVADIATGALTQKTFGPQEEYEPTWSPDGTTIAFVSGMGVARGHGASVSGVDIDSVDAAGKIASLLSLPKAPANEGGGPLGGGGPHVDSPAWSPDGKRIAYTLATGSESELMVAGKKVGSAEDVFPFYPSWLSATSILYTGDGKILITDLTTNATRSIPFSATFHIDRPGYRHRIYDFQSVTAKQAKGILHPSLSPNGKQVVFEALNQLWLMDIGHAPQPLLSDSYFKQDPSFSPDGKSIVYSSDKGGFEAVYIMDLASRVSRRVTMQSESAELMPSWSPDQSKIAYHDQNGATYVVEITSGRTKQVAAEVFGPSQPSWFVNGSALVQTSLTAYNMRFREGTSRIVTIDLKTGKTIVTEPAPFETILTRGYDGPTYSPDGKQMAFVMDDFLWTRPVDASGVPAGLAKQISKEMADSLSWSGDSKQILYLSNGVLRMTAADGTSSPRTIPLELTYHRTLPEGRIVVHAGKLWDGLSADVKNDVDLTIVGNRIVSIESHQTIAQPAGAGVRYIDASHQTVIPGLWESHNHHYGGISEAGDSSGRLWLAYGFTTLQSQGDEGYIQEEVRESFAADRRVGPRYFASAELIDGERIFYPTNRSIRSEAQIAREFARDQALDVDNYKTYVRLPHAQQKEVMELAHSKAGVWVSSHYGLPGLTYGMDGMSHVSATSRWGYAYTRSNTGITYDDIRTLFPAAGMWDISTAFASIAMYAADPKLADDPRLTALDPPWAQHALLQTRDRMVKTNQSATAQGLKREDETVAALYNASDSVLAGIDSAAPGAQVPLHLSLRAEVKYGLKPWQALQTATILPARAFGYGKDLGSIEPGKLADLAIIDGDPLTDIDDLIKVVGVLVDGRYHTPADLMTPFAK